MLAHILTDMLAHILTDMLAHMLTHMLTDMLAHILTDMLTHMLKYQILSPRRESFEIALGNICAGFVINKEGRKKNKPAACGFYAFNQHE